MERFDSSHKTDPELWAATGGPYFPTTQEIGFVEADIDRVIDTFIEWRCELGQKPIRTDVDGGFSEGIQALAPLTVGDRRRFVFFKCGPMWTAVFDNSASGTDATSLASYMAQRIGCRGLRVVATANCERTYGATIFELYGPESTDFLNYIRTISATNDGGRWRFDTAGEALPFEDVSCYQKRRIREMFTPRMLAAYLSAIGVEAFDTANYVSPVLVERTDRGPTGIVELSFEEAASRFRANA